MSLLSKIKSGYQQKKSIWVFHSAPGVGKTTLASKFPKCLILDLENGSSHLPVDRLTSADIPNYKTLLEVVNDLQSDKKYETITIDSATVLESYIHQHICGDKHQSIEDLGFGKGFTQAREELQKLMQKLQLLTADKDVIITAHSQVKGFTDPISNSSYDRYLLQVQVKFAEILTSTADNVLFLKHAVDTTVDQKTKKTQAFSSGKRLIMTEWSAAYEAKNRLNLPPELPLDYNALVNAIENAKPRSAAELKADIKALLLKADANTAELATSKAKEAGDDVIALVRIKTKLTDMVSRA